MIWMQPGYCGECPVHCDCPMSLTRRKVRAVAAILSLGSAIDYCCLMDPMMNVEWAMSPTSPMSPMAKEGAAGKMFSGSVMIDCLMSLRRKMEGPVGKMFFSGSAMNYGCLMSLTKRRVGVVESP